MRRSVLTLALAPLALTLSLSPAAQADPAARARAVQAIVDEFVANQKTNPGPGLAVSVSSEDEPAQTFVAGVRRQGMSYKIAASDSFLLGSCTKSFTSVLMARLVSQKKVDWKSTLGDLGKRLGIPVAAGYQNVTIDDILVHRGGVPEWNPPKLNREQAMIALLAKGPDGNQGSDHYSDTGFGLLGFLEEHLFNEDEYRKPESDRHLRKWNQLVIDEILEPLHISGATFQRGVFPDGKKSLPWEELVKTGPVPHRSLTPDKGMDDFFEHPDTAPAAALGLSMGEWNKFGRFLMLGAQPHPAENPVITGPDGAEAFAHLFATPPTDKSGHKGYLRYGSFITTGNEYNYTGVNGGFTAFFSFDKPTTDQKLVITAATNSYYGWSMGALTKLHTDIEKAWSAH